MRYVNERREQPTDDMMTDLLRAEIEDETGVKRCLSDLELIAFIMLISGSSGRHASNTRCSQPFPAPRRQ